MYGRAAVWREYRFGLTWAFGSLVAAPYHTDAYPSFGDTNPGETPDKWLENFVIERFEHDQVTRMHRRYFTLRKYLYIITFSLFVSSPPRYGRAHGVGVA